ncbi:putative quinol monooxygenase [Halodesulfovibrio sp.]|jgi:quinol monooxygenase YgiN|uniref:putative quinol monooxygenase n=1 Tax=Halodesulfovibrio sp. TaxID=1912772 RepID=UPI0025F3245B|nr:putative quinol monooxygenase [Halodesulfovibrio sp.]MCT4627403.1 antibiotic biosynthesis monooxygenase [Halodesulfovibrio sp.]
MAKMQIVANGWHLVRTCVKNYLSNGVSMKVEDRFIVTVLLRAKQDKVMDLRQYTQQLAENCRHHEGLLLHTMHQDQLNPTVFFVYEHFASEKAFQEHLNSDAFKNVQSELSEFLNGKPEIQTWSMSKQMGCFGE